MAENRQIAKDVLSAVGGSENVQKVAHCMTRLRFNLKDESAVSDDTVKAVDGVLGVVHVNGQLQVIIGQNVTKVYEELCKLGGFAEQAAIEENLDAPAKEKLTLKKIGRNILDYVAGSMMPIIPVIVAASMFKTLQTLLGPGMLGLITEESSLYLLGNIMYNAFAYFLPIYLPSART